MADIGLLLVNSWNVIAASGAIRGGFATISAIAQIPVAEFPPRH
ncbi:hypothetical protein QKW60_13590 [Defluviimonas aestuarii]|jgi:hypothetical protein|nr:hypothetical protein [Defluviimonas aestuarii]MDI3337447.1 hypothetical protein [Defluviimonas aestuarii]